MAGRECSRNEGIADSERLTSVFSASSHRRRSAIDGGAMQGEIAMTVKLGRTIQKYLNASNKGTT
jgi:hypothetical protein